MTVQSVSTSQQNPFQAQEHGIIYVVSIDSLPGCQSPTLLLVSSQSTRCTMNGLEKPPRAAVTAACMYMRRTLRLVHYFIFALV